QPFHGSGRQGPNGALRRLDYYCVDDVDRGAVLEDRDEYISENLGPRRRSFVPEAPITAAYLCHRPRPSAPGRPTSFWPRYAGNLKVGDQVGGRPPRLVALGGRGWRLRISGRPGVAAGPRVSRLRLRRVRLRQPRWPALATSSRCRRAESGS